MCWLVMGWICGCDGGDGLCVVEFGGEFVGVLK